MAFSYDLATDRGRVRLLIPDTEAAKAVFQDEEIDAFLGLGGQNVRIAAAHALDTIANNQALVLKVIRNMDLQTDGAAVARALREGAAALRQAAADEPAFGLAGMSLTSFNVREIIVKAAMRNAL